jgi:thiol-disulfide isomerase/thioredoxin
MKIMKRLFTLAILCTALALSVSARVKTIVSPYYKYNGSGFAVHRIAMSDTATILYCTVEQSKKSDWSLSSASALRANGKKYAIRHALRFICPKDSAPRLAPFAFDKNARQTITNRKQFLSYNVDSLILYFAPMPSSTKTFDFSENESPDAWRFYGLRTDGKPWPSNLTQVAEPKGEITELPDYVCKEKGTAVLEGHLYGVEGVRGMTLNLVPTSNIIGEPTTKWSVDSLGNYRVETVTYRPQLIRIGFPPFSTVENQLLVMMVPGETQHLDWDVTAAEKAIHDSKNHKFDKCQFFLASGRYAPLTYAANMGEDFMSLTINILEEDSVERFVKGRRAELDKSLENIKNDNRYSPVQRDYLMMNMEEHFLNEMSLYDKSKLGYLVQVNHEKGDAEKEKLWTEKRKHFSWTAFSTGNFIYGRDGRSFFVNGYIPEFMEANGLTNSNYYKWIKGYDDAMILAQRIAKFHPVADEAEWTKISPIFRPELQMLNDSVKKQMAQAHYDPSKVHIVDFSNVPANQVIKMLKERYKGRTVLVDCWATWCGPCRMGIKAMQPLEQEMEGKNVVFVYATNETSPLSEWKESIDAMPGDHYRLTDKQFATLPTNKGIPAYLIFDGQGNELLEQTGWSSTNIDLFRKTITKSLGE